MYLIFDTETYKSINLQVVNIHADKPFLYTYVVLDNKLNQVEEGWFLPQDPLKMDHFIELFKQCSTIVGANIKYDLHMCLNDINNSIDINLLDQKNYVDIEVLARLCLPCDVQDDKTFSIGLKPLANRYVGVDSNKEEQQLKRELNQLTSAHQNKYKEYIKAKFPTLSVKEVNELVYNTYKNELWFKYFDKYNWFKSTRDDFFRLYRRPDYRDCANIYTYAMTDSRLTAKLFKLWFVKIIGLKQTDALKRISAATVPLLVMEREGLEIDINKLLTDRKIVQEEYDRVCKTIIDPRTGKIITPSQNAKLKEIYEYESGLLLDNADKKTRAKLGSKSPTANKVTYARELEKYLTTYMTGLLKKIIYENGVAKIYTQYNQAGTITGRLSSDFQQFPKFPLELQDDSGRIINIRSWFVVPKGATNVCYFDYANMELRLQCEWSALISGTPDLIMTRAFTPYKCIEKDGKYYLEENPNVEWHPTDLHAMTAKKAFNVDETNPDWAHYRKLGKATNFASNYGCGPSTLAANLDIPFDQAEKLIKGYKETFKGVTLFGNWLKKRCWTIDQHPTLFKRYFYSNSAFKLANYLVQGSGADILMDKLRVSYEWLKQHPDWKYVICVHDEIGFAYSGNDIEQEKRDIQEIQKLMQVQLTAVLMEVDCEVATTNWGNKMKYEEVFKNE